MSKRNPTLPDNARLDQFDDFPLGHNSVGEVQPPIFPLHRAVQIQSITQPVIWWTPDRITKRSTTKTVMSFCKNPAKAKMNLMKMGGKKSCIPGLKLFGTQWVWNIFNGVTQTVSVVIGRIDAPAKKDKASSLGIHCCEKRCCGFFLFIPFISCPMMRCVFYSVCHRIHLSILHDHLHPEGGLSLSKQALLHPLKQHQRLFDGSISPRWLRNIMAFQLLAFLMAHIRVTPEGGEKKWVKHHPCTNISTYPTLTCE